MNRDEQIDYIADCLNEGLGDIGFDPQLIMPRLIGSQQRETVAQFIARCCLEAMDQWRELLDDFGPDES